MPRSVRVGALLIVGLTLLAYVPAIRAGFIWDDDYYVTRNAALRSAQGLRDIWVKPLASPQYYPVTFSTLWLEYRLWGLHPAGYHVVNILLHAANALLLWAVLSVLAVPGAWVASAVFALHPVHVESVAWIAERKNVLSGLFYLAALFIYLRIDETSDGPSRRRRRLVLAALLLCALLSKSVTCTFPLAALLIAWGLRKRLRRQEILQAVPLVALSALVGAVTVWMERFRVGAAGGDWSLSWAERGLVAGRAVWFYLGKLAWPSPLIFIYPRWAIDPSSWRQWGFPLSAFGMLVMLFASRARIGRAPLTAWALFLVTLAPALGFVSFYPMRYSFVADHFQYLASMSIIALAVSLAAQGLRGLPTRARRLCGAGAAAGVLACLGSLTWRQAAIYRSAETVWQDTLAKDPGSWMAHTNLGVLRYEQGKLDEAMGHHLAAIRLNPSLPTGYYNVGLILADRGEYQAASARYEEALRLNPGYAEAHNNLGIALAKQGQLDAALRHFSEALRLAPLFTEAQTNFTLALSQQRAQETAASSAAK